MYIFTGFSYVNYDYKDCIHHQTGATEYCPHLKNNTDIIKIVLE